MGKTAPSPSLWGAWADDWRYYYRHGRRWFSPLIQAGFWVTIHYRLGHYYPRSCSRLLRPFLGVLYHFSRLFIFSFTGADIRTGARIGRFFDVHTSQGIVIGDNVVIGDSCVINTGVCIAHRADNQGQGVATLGDHVWLGMGAKIIGKVTIGDWVMVGANAVVTRDIPSYSIATGIPAVARPRKDRRPPSESSSAPSDPQSTTTATPIHE